VLLSEEMRRVLVFSRSTETWWRQLAKHASHVEAHSAAPEGDMGPVDPEAIPILAVPPTAALIEGRRSYALKQAEIEHKLAAKFRKKWLPTIAMARLSAVGPTLAWNGTGEDGYDAQTADDEPVFLDLGEDDCDNFYEDEDDE
jgi:hypothetical protein